MRWPYGARWRFSGASRSTRHFTNSLNRTFLGDDLTRTSEGNPTFSWAIHQPNVCEGRRELRAVQRHISHGFSSIQALSIGARGFAPAATNACRSRMASRRSTPNSWEKDLDMIAERLPQIGPRLEPEDLDYIIECALAVANKAQRLMRATDLCGK